MFNTQYKEMTISEFNKEYGVNTYGYPTYKIATKDDIGTYVQLIPDGQIIPYFCKWRQWNFKPKILKKLDMPIILLLGDKQ
jgi:hypothetical protein